MSPPRLLVIETATEMWSVALFSDGGLVAGDGAMLGRGHAEALVPMIAALPGRGRADMIAIGRGPGSFTGVRVGLAAARALGLAWGVPVLGYPTLALTAAMARDMAGAQPCLVATTAGHGEWFGAGFDALGAVVRGLAASGVAICVVEHNVAFIRDLCDEGVFMFAGKVLARGDVESLVADPRLTELYFGT